MPKTILIADDRSSMRRSVRFLLERRHADLVVQEAVDGVEAIELAKQTKPDLILLDVAMPGLNGVEVATILRNTLPETPIILFTMYTDLPADSLSGFLGVDFISKVDGLPKLLERVDACYHRVQTTKSLCASEVVQIGSEGVPKLDDVPPDHVKYPGWNDTRVPEDAECQDTRGIVRGRYIRCGKPAKS